ncbi:putative reverse transcriptase/RNA-dependent DNA polymerase [Citrus sinensis]|nr:putative reverse transcriptase/RNA-dependent DNA polymerase [Citrus sinensis]
MSQAKCNGGMGFRDFSSFNQVLLVKQGWRIQQCPNSLVARVLQAKYFQSKNFLDAKLGSNPSYIWRSILWGRQIICSGSRWRVGNGKKIQIHKTNWIPKPLTFKLVVQPTLPSDTMVFKLINEANCWDEKMIHEHFDKMDADLITKIPLPRRPREDELIWHYGKNGQFSVKSGYQTTLQIKFPAMPSSSVASKNECNIIWSLALPQKIRIFAWRAAKNLLPSAENLWKKKIIPEPTCQESVAIQRKKGESPDYECTSSGMESPSRWLCKSHLDVVINSEKNLAGLGAVIRDDSGHVTAAAIKISKFHGDVSYDEAEAMEWGMLVAREAKVKVVIVESDSQGVVSLVNNKQGNKTEIYGVVSEIQKLKENFECVSIKYTPRSCNVIAHSLAKLALEKRETVVWKGSYPSQVMCLFSSLN